MATLRKSAPELTLWFCRAASEAPSDDGPPDDLLGSFVFAWRFVAAFAKHVCPFAEATTGAGITFTCNGRLLNFRRGPRVASRELRASFAVDKPGLVYMSGEPAPTVSTRDAERAAFDEPVLT